MNPPAGSSLKGKRVLVTGGASGLGAAITDALTEQGARPMIIDQQLPASADPVDHIRADLSDRGAAERAVHGLARSADGLDAVVTAAGIDSCGRFGEMAAEDWERVIQVNLMGTVAVVRAAVPYLCHARGRVVTCASTLGLRAQAEETAGCASEFGLVGFTRALAAEYAGQVGVTLLVPGGMDTPFLADRDDAHTPPGNALSRPEEVAPAVLFALSQPVGCEIRELVVCPSGEPSWP